MGFYTTVDEKYEKATQAKAAVDRFCEDINLDGLLNEMAKPLIACGNDFWLKLTPDRLTETIRLCQLMLFNASGSALFQT